jgi:LmbE family N-acetylglucosaminyl deacetylase
MPQQRLWTTAILFGVLAAAPVTCDEPAPDRHQHTPPPSIAVSRETRLLVIAPHPDDETLAAGGLMQRVHTAHGVVRVVYLTDGDGYPEGVQAEDHVVAPTATDYRGYGRQRRHEARAAMSALKLRDYTLTFLNFPDGGLSALMTKYWSERAGAYRSPFTRLDRPPRAQTLVPDTEYRGEDLTQELAAVISEFHPTIVLAPRKEDQHPDHCASWFFVADALGDVRRVQPELTVDLINYVIHFGGWPFQDDSPTLPPPPGLLGGASGWIRFELTRSEALAKRAALQQYQSQVLVMGWFLAAFARGNEMFSRPAPPHVTLPARRSPCE